MAELISFGKFPPTSGGEFEKECCRRLREDLPDGAIVAASIELSRRDGSFYELDAVVSAPGFCELLEFKCIRPDVDVHEDLLRSGIGYVHDRAFSRVNQKARVLADRLRRPPFQNTSVPWVSTSVVVPDETTVTFHVDEHRRKPPVEQISQAIHRCRSRLGSDRSLLGTAETRTKNRNGWLAFRDSATITGKSRHKLGRFVIKRRLASIAGAPEYHAVDEPPCPEDVHLREFPLDPTLPAEELRQFLDKVAREFRVLRRLRHPHVACVVGHFQTGASWVQVSDWFDGKTLEEELDALVKLSLFERIGFFQSLVDTLQFCHEKGVFHRNIDGKAVLVADDLQDFRVCRFDYAGDIAATSSVTTQRLAVRDPRLIPPEELVGGSSGNMRLGDIFQLGVLLYRLLSDGAWPFETSLAYATSEGQVAAPTTSLDSASEEALKCSTWMMSVDPLKRPDMLARVASRLQNLGA